MRSCANPPSLLRRPTLFGVLAVLAVLFLSTFAKDAHAAGSFKIKSTEVNEVSGAWHVYVTVELPKAPLIAHQPMRFVFTQTVAFDRSLVDGHDQPVNSRRVLSPTVVRTESLDVDFSDSSGKIFKGTRFDFGLTRDRGYEAGEYKVDVRTSDGTVVGTSQSLVLKGDNEVQDRRSMNFAAEKKGIKKVEGYDAGAPAPANDEPPPSSFGSGEVEPTGTPQPFISPEGYERTPEEEIKTRPKGCGCSVPGERTSMHAAAWLAPLAGLGLVVARRRRSRA